MLKNRIMSYFKGHSGMGLLSLSDELLLKIIYFINSKESIISLSRTCHKFNNLLQDRSLCQDMSFPWNAIIERSRLIVFLAEFNRANLITKLQIHDLYWIPSGTIRNIVLKLKNLKSLYAAGTKLSWLHLTQIMQSRELEDLSWTSDHLLEKFVPVCIKEKEAYNEIFEMRETLLKLKFLLVQIPITPWPPSRIASYSVLNSLISLCSGLEELYILSSTQTLDQDSSTVSTFSPKDHMYQDVDFPNLKSFVINIKETPQFFCPAPVKFLCQSLKKNRNGGLLTKFWIDHPQLPLDSVIREISVESDRDVPTSSNNASSEKSKSLSKMDSLEYFTFPITDQAIKFVKNNKFEKLKHLRITKGISRVVPLNGMFFQATQLKSLMMKAYNYKLDWFSFFQAHPMLEELNVSDCICESLKYPEICLAITSLKHLRKLSLPVFALFEIKDHDIVSDYQIALTKEVPTSSNVPETVEVELTYSFKPKRISPITTEKELGVSGLDLATYYSSHVTEFELGFTDEETRVGRMITSSLGNIKRWKNLVKLTLDRVPILDGKFFIELADCCNLESLRLRELGPRGKCVYMKELCVAIKSWPKLKTFRLEQNYIGSSVPLFESLSTCKDLERILIFSPSNDQPLQKAPLKKLIETAKRLVVVYLVIGSTTISDSKEIRISIEKKFLPIRPPFNIFIGNEINPPEIRKVCPLIHYRQLVANESQVCDIWLESFPLKS